jgi:hypothetical protein
MDFSFITISAIINLSCDKRLYRSKNKLNLHNLQFHNSMRNKFSINLKMLVQALFMLIIIHNVSAQSKINVLVFSKTAAFRHQSIGAGKIALEKMAKEKGFGVSFTNLISRNSIPLYF